MHTPNRVFLIFLISGIFLPFLKAQSGLKCIQNLSISANNGETIATTCSSSGIDEGTIRFRTNTVATPIGFLIVDTQNVILRYSKSPFLNFSGLPAATFKVYAFSYLGTLKVTTGTGLETAILASRCYELSQNFVTVSNFPPEGGSLSTDSGSNQISFCHGDGQSDILFLQYERPIDSSIIVIENQLNEVVYLGNDTSFDFETFEAGFYTIKGIGYSGTLLIEQGSIIEANTRYASGCYGVTEEIIYVENITPNGGRLSAIIGETAFTVCRISNQNLEELIQIEVFGQSNQLYAFYLVNEEGIIEAISNDGWFDLKNLDANSKKIYGMSFPNTSPLGVGENWDVSALSGEGCAGIAENFITVDFKTVQGGNISTSLGLDTLFYCSIEAGEKINLLTDAIDISENYQFIVTNRNDKPILSLLGNQVNTQLFPEGEFHIWGLNYSGTLTLDYEKPVTEQELSTECFALSANPVVFFKYYNEPFEISFTNGKEFMYLCPEEGFPDIISFGAVASNSNLLQYAIINAEGIIIGQTTNQVYDFGGLANGNYQIVGVSYLGEKLDVIGQILDTANFSDDCYSLSTNALRVTIDNIEAGTVSLPPTQASTITTCYPILEPLFDDPTFPEGVNKAWVIVDDNQKIVGVPERDDINLTGLDLGDYYLYGLIYSGSLLYDIGVDLSNQNFSDDCYSLSTNAIAINYSGPDGGQLASHTLFTCSSSAEDKLVLSKSVESHPDFEFKWVIADLGSNEIISITDNDTISKSNFGEGNFQILGISYQELPQDLLVGEQLVLDTFDNSPCHDWSSGEIIWKNLQPKAPELSFSENPSILSDTICLLKNNRYIVSLSSSFQPDYPNTIVVTDDMGVVLDENAGFQPDFSAYDCKDCQIYSLVSEQEIAVVRGDTLFNFIEQSPTCIDWSDKLDVRKIEVEGGQLTTDWNTTSDTLYTCLQDGISDWITVSAINSAESEKYSFFITNSNDEILGLLSNPTRDYDNNIFKELRIYGLSHGGNLNFSIGSPIASVTSEGGCYDWAANFITIISDKVEGGEISSAYGSEYFDYCGDGSQILKLQTTSTSDIGYAYLLLNEEGNIQRISLDANLSLNGMGAGLYEIKAISYSGILNLTEGNAIGENPTDGCFDWAENSLTFNLLGEVDPGTISAVGYEADTIYTCPGGDNASIVELSNTSSLIEGAYAYMLTDEEDVILYPSLSNTGLINFENAPEGTYRAYGISYTGQLNGQANRDIRTLELSNECYAYTPKPLTIINRPPVSGSIYALGHEGEDLIWTQNCDSSNPTESWTFFFEEKIGFSKFLASDPSGTIIAIFNEGDSFQIPSEYPCQNLLITGLTHSGQINNLVGQNINQLEIEQCFAFSLNQLTLSPSEGAQTFPQQIEVYQPNDNRIPSLKIYPNPIIAGSDLYVSIPQLSSNNIEEEYKIRIFDMMGKRLNGKDFIIQNGETEIKLGKLQRGIYLIDIWNNYQRIGIRKLLVK